MSALAPGPGAGDRAKIAGALGLSELQLEALAAAELTAFGRRERTSVATSRIEALLGLKPGALAQLSSAAPLTFAAARRGRAHLLPVGAFKTERSSAQPGRRFVLGQAQGERIARYLVTLAASTPLVIDYSHATLRATQTGERAPAAGWVVGAEWSDRTGLHVDVEWTQRGAESIDSGEFKHASPFILSEGSEVLAVGPVALVREPAIAGLGEVQAF